MFVLLMLFDIKQIKLILLVYDSRTVYRYSRDYIQMEVSKH